ncbi:MAG: division/cell wall cluster transcriptional repressor MraZ [Dehalococcoidia bacterium]|jgi:MraZ protein
MFYGEYQYKVDDKGRVPLPPKFRRELKMGMVLTKGMEKYIAVYPPAEWKRVSDNLAAKAVSPASLRKLTRALFGNAFSASLDGQGRIVLPHTLRDYAEIGDTAIVVGANNNVELWSEDEWKAEKISADEQAAKISESYGE